MSTFEDVQVEYHGLREVGAEVVVPNTAHIRGRQGIDVAARSTFVFTVEKARITRQRLFQEQDGALEAAGCGGNPESASAEDAIRMVRSQPSPGPAGRHA